MSSDQLRQHIKIIRLKRHILELTALLLLTACNQNNSIGKDKPYLDSSHGGETITQGEQQQSEKRQSFKSISEIDATYSTWVQLNGDTASLALRFWNRHKDTLIVSYSPECILYFPYKLDSNKIVVFWDNYIDTKYQFDIVKAINKTDKKLIGKPFMILELANDTTLKATYPMKDLIKKINGSSKERKFFPDKYNIADADYQ